MMHGSCRRRMLMLLCLVGLITLSPVPIFAAAYVVSIDGLSLAEGERIAGVTLELSNGHFTAITSMPVGWLVSVEPAPSARLEMRAVQGVGFVDDISALKNIVRIESEGHLTVTGTLRIYVSLEDEEKLLSLDRHRIRMTRVDREGAAQGRAD